MTKNNKTITCDTCELYFGEEPNDFYDFALIRDSILRSSLVKLHDDVAMCFRCFCELA